MNHSYPSTHRPRPHPSTPKTGECGGDGSHRVGSSRVDVSLVWVGFEVLSTKGSWLPSFLQGPQPTELHGNSDPFLPFFSVSCHCSPHTLSALAAPAKRCLPFILSSASGGWLWFGSHTWQHSECCSQLLVWRWGPYGAQGGVYAMLGNPVQASCMPCMCFFLGAISPAHPCSSIQPESWGSFLIT